MWNSLPVLPAVSHRESTLLRRPQGDLMNAKLLLNISAAGEFNYFIIAPFSCQSKGNEVSFKEKVLPEYNFSGFYKSIFDITGVLCYN